MYPRRTLAALFILTLLAAAALRHLQRHGVAGGSPASRRVFPKNLDAAGEITIERAGETMTLQRQNNAWEITRPIAVPADAQRVRRLLDALETLPVIDQFPVRSLAQRRLTPADLGFSPPQTRLTLALAGRPPAVLEIGRASPSGHALYLRHSGLPGQILVTDAALLGELPAAFLEFRRRLLLPAPPSSVTALEIRHPSRPTFRVIRRENNLWHLVQPITGRASQTAVNELAQALAGLTIENFIWPPALSDPMATPRPPALATLGLDPESALSLLVWEQSQPSSPLRLRFGHPVPGDPGHLYALSTDQATLVTVTNALLALLGQPPSEFRDKRLFREDPSLLAALAIRYPGQTLGLECEDDQWILTAPTRSRANPLMVRALVETLLNLRADKIIINGGDDGGIPGVSGGADMPETSDPPSAFPPPSSRQLLLAFKGQPPVTLHFDHTPLDTSFTFADDPAITYLIASTNLPPELINLDEATRLADLQILDLLPETIQRLTFATASSTQVLERAAGHAPVFEAIASLRAERVEQLTPLLPVQRGALGLSPPSLEITLDLSGDTPSFRRVLSIGAPASPGTFHALLRGSDILYAIPVGALPAGLPSPSANGSIEPTP